MWGQCDVIFTFIFPRPLRVFLTDRIFPAWFYFRNAVLCLQEEMLKQRYLLLSCLIYNFLFFTHQTDQRIFVQLNWQKIWAVLNLTWNKHWLYHRWIIRVGIYDFPCETHFPSMLSQLIFLFEVSSSNLCPTKSWSIVCLSSCLGSI